MALYSFVIKESAGNKLNGVTYDGSINMLIVSSTFGVTSTKNARIRINRNKKARAEN